jgi:hypothetical protein
MWLATFGITLDLSHWPLRVILWAVATGRVSVTYFVYQVRYESEAAQRVSLGDAIEFESLRGPLTEHGASVAFYWPERGAGQSFVAVEGALFNAGVAQVIEIWSGGSVSFKEEGMTVEAALPRPLGVCSNCGAAPPRHMPRCEFADMFPDRVDEGPNIV